MLTSCFLFLQVLVRYSSFNMLQETLYQTSLQGIGRAVALLFSKEGAKVVISECVLSVSPKYMLVLNAP
jgi:hypothetical protein